MFVYASKFTFAFLAPQLNPLKLDKGADAADNLEHLIGFLTEIIESIFNSANECPR